MKAKKTIVAVAALTTLGAWVSIYFTVYGAGPGIDTTPHAALGRVMAQQALALVGRSGQFIVLSRDTTAFENPASEAQLASFRKTVLRAHRTIRTVRRLQVDPLRPVQVPPGDFFELLRRAPEGDVIVSFMGPPLLTEAQSRQLGLTKPAVVAFCSGSLAEYIDLKLLFEEGLLAAALVPKQSGGQKLPERPGAGRNNEAYVVVTRANLSDLPSAVRPD